MAAVVDENYAPTLPPQFFGVGWPFSGKGTHGGTRRRSKFSSSPQKSKFRNRIERIFSPNKQHEPHPRIERSKTFGSSRDARRQAQTSRGIED